MENTKYPNNLLPIGFVFTTFIICVFIVIAIITITNFEWLKEAYSWIINNNEDMLKILSILFFIWITSLLPKN